jgi:hypothetical protein
MQQIDALLASPDKISAATKIVDREASNLKNWRTHLLCAGSLALLFVVNLLRGSSKNPSIINLQKCSALDWTIASAFIVFNVTLSVT